MIRLLHVEDDAALADMVPMVLNRKCDQFEIETASDAEEGLKRLSESAFDCIVSDYDMPGQDGIEFLKTVREEYPKLPFILFTGNGSEDIASEAISAGVTDYLQKGTGTEQYDLLANRITNAVSGYRAQRDYQALFENVNIGLAINDIETGEIIDANQAFADIKDQDRADLVGKTPVALLPDGSHYTEDDVKQLIDKAVENGTHSFEWPSETADGGRRWEAVTLTVTVLNGRQRVLATIEDITEHKARKQKLERQTDLFRQVRDIANIGVWEYDTTTGEVSWGPNVYDMHDIPQDADLTLEKIVDCYHPDDRQTVRSTLVEGAETGEPFEYEARMLTETGEQRWACVRGQPQFGADSVVGIRGTIQDITEQKNRERQLQRQNERLEKFASMVSHELQNPLHTASGKLELTAAECEGNHQAVADAHAQMERVIQDLLTFARTGTEAVNESAVNLEQLATSCWERIQSGEASLVIDTEQVVQADRSHFRHLLENLFQNAIEHGGADVSITVGNLEDGFYIEDDGPGIPKADRETVFEDGHSTSSEGTGFGLSIVTEVADAHGWDLNITDGRDGGARFELTGVKSVSSSRDGRSASSVLAED